MSSNILGKLNKKLIAVVTITAIIVVILFLTSGLTLPYLRMIMAKTGKMNIARVCHTATLLNNGKVLVAGGLSGSSHNTKAVKSAEMYNYKTNKFTLISDMNVPRRAHTATLLNNGKVLITGGSGDNTTEIYDPETNTFKLTGSMNEIRTLHSATLLNDGKVLLTGGNNGTERDKYPNKFEGEPLNSAEIYDPKTEKFTSINNMNLTYLTHQSILLPDGKVFITNEYYTRYYPQPPHLTIYNTEIYAPKTNKFTLVKGLNDNDSDTRCFTNKVIALENEKILNICRLTGPYGKIEIYDPLIDKVKFITKVEKGKRDPKLVLLNNGKVMVIGGSYGKGQHISRDINIYDPKGEKGHSYSIYSYLRTNSMPSSATLLPSGKVLITGARKHFEVQ